MRTIGRDSEKEKKQHILDVTRLVISRRTTRNAPAKNAFFNPELGMGDTGYSVGNA